MEETLDPILRRLRDIENKRDGILELGDIPRLFELDTEYHILSIYYDNRDNEDNLNGLTLNRKLLDGLSRQTQMSLVCLIDGVCHVTSR